MATKAISPKTTMNSPVEPAESLESPQDAVIDNVTALQQEAAESVEHAGTAILEGVGKVQKEIAQFVSTRIREDIEAQQQFLRCRSLDDVREVQMRFFKTAMDQYSAETARLMKLGSEIVTRSMERTGN